MRRQYSELILCNENQFWRFKEITQEFLVMTEFSVEEIRRQFSNNILEFFSREDAKEIEALLNDQNVGIQFSQNTYLIANAHNRTIYVLIQCQKDNLTSDSVKITLIDLSAETKEKNVLKRRLDSLESSSPAGLCQVLMNDEWTIVWNNQNFLDIIGYTKQQFIEELQGKASYVHPEDQHIIAKQFAEISGQPGQVLSTEFRIIRRDGEVRTLISTFAYTGESYQEEPYKGIPVFYSSGVDITEIKRIQELELAAERFRIAMEQTSSCVWEYNISERTILASQSLKKLTGWDGDIQNVPDSLIVTRLVHKDSIDDCKKLFAALLDGCEQIESIIKIRNINKGYLWVKIAMTVLFDELGIPFKAVALMEDITKRHNLKLRYREEEHRRMAMAFNQIFACQLNITQNKILEANLELFPKYREGELCAAGFTQRYASNYVHPDNRAEFLQKFSMQNIKENFKRGNTEITLEYRVFKDKNDDSYSWQQASVSTLQEPLQGELWAYVYIKDITQQKIDELELRRHAERDSLTNLYNRYTIELKCREALQDNPKNRLLAMLSLDLDGFKNVNDSYGHLCGDELLKNVARLMKNIFPAGEALIGRLGGDEFLIFLLNCSDFEMVKQKSKLLCDEIYHTFSNPYNVSASVGVALAPTDGADYESLYYSADIALYEAKRLGKNCYIFHDKSMEVKDEIAKQGVSREWLLDESNDIIYVADLYTYDLLYMNKNTKALFNIEGESYKGEKCFRVLQKLDQPCDFCTNHLLSRDSFYTWQYHNPNINQTLFLKDRIVDWYGRAARIELATDITEVDLQSKAVAEQLHIDSTIVNCYKNFNEVESFEIALDSSMRIVGELYQADRVWIVRPNQETGMFFFKYLWLRNGVKPPIVSDKECQMLTDEFSKIEKGDAYHLNNYNELEEINPELHMIYKRNNTFCQRTLPLFFHGVVAGFIGVDNPTKLRDDLAALETLGYCVAAEITKLKLIERIEQLSAYDQLTGLYNRTQFIHYVESLPVRKLSSLGVVIVDLNELGKINHLHGYKAGDQAITSVATLLKDIFTSNLVFRIRSERFIAMYENCGEKALLAQVKLISNDKSTLRENKITLGHAWSDNKSSFRKLMEQARKMLLKNLSKKSL